MTDSEETQDVTFDAVRVEELHRRLDEQCSDYSVGEIMFGLAATLALVVKNTETEEDTAIDADAMMATFRAFYDRCYSEIRPVGDGELRH